MQEPTETEAQAIGYKRPPGKTQFKPGKSGNPRGRPKRKNPDIGVALNKALNDKVVVTGLGKTLTGFETVIQSIVHRVLQGESKAIPELLRLFTKAKMFKPVPDPTRLTGVVVAPPDYQRDRDLGIQGGWYEVSEGERVLGRPRNKEGLQLRRLAMNDPDGVQNSAVSDFRQVDTTNVDVGGTGYKRPPVKNRFRKGQSGNPFGRRKGQRNMPAILNDILAQTVTVKQGNKSERMTKGEAAIKMILSKAQNGDCRAIDAISVLAEKIGRIDDVNSETGLRNGIMLVPGVAKSSAEWNIAMAAHRKRSAEKDELRKADAPRLKREEAALRNTIALHKGTPLADDAAARLDELTHSIEYLSNLYTLQSLESLGSPRGRCRWRTQSG